MPRLMSWTVACLAAALQISAADAQGNIDAGKTPAQIFGDTCAGCHRSARELRRASASFLRSHYTAGSDEASAMANYLAGVGGGGEPRPSTATQSQPKRPPADVAKQPAPVRPAVEQAKSGSASAAAPNSPSSAQPQPKSRPSASAQARSLPEARAFQEERHVEPTPSASPPLPVLQPFEE